MLSAYVSGDDVDYMGSGECSSAEGQARTSKKQ